MTPDEHAAKAHEMLGAVSAIQQRLFDRVLSGALADDHSVIAVAGLTAALAQVHATLATIPPAPALRPAEAADFRGFGDAKDLYDDSLNFHGEDDPGRLGGYADDGSGRAVLDADDDPSTGWEGLGPP